MTAFTIRPFRSQDWDALCRIYEPAARAEIARTGTDPDAFRPLPEEEDPERFQRVNSAMVACIDGRVVGFVAWRDREEWLGSGYLSWLYVDPAHHRRGVGDGLMAAAMAALADQAWTLVKQGNEPAIGLYRKHGMQIVRSRPAGSRGYTSTELRMAVPTSRKADPSVPDFGKST